LKPVYGISLSNIPYVLLERRYPALKDLLKNIIALKHIMGYALKDLLKHTP